MRHKSFILVAVVLLALVAGAVGAYAYDSSRKNQMADGVTVAGVDVGGLSAEQARTKVKAQLAGALDQPIVVRRGDHRFTLSAQDAGVQADVGGMIDEGLEKSRQGSIVSRVTRDLTGGSENVQVPARITYSETAVNGLVKRVSARLDQAPRDATVDFPSLAEVKEQPGVKVRTAALKQRIEQALAVPGVDRVVKPPVDVVQPKVTKAQLAKKYPVVLVADRNNFHLLLYKDLKLTKTYTVAVGAVGFDTPAGLYHIQNKAVDPVWTVPHSAWAGDLAGQTVPGGTPENPLKARWLGIFDGAGIHGTDETYSLGSAASHGCIRMAIPDVIELYDQVPVGAPIYIA
jgi:lipoprotein-anchoring transpeptidase ErfK/SrfK